MKDIGNNFLVRFHMCLINLFRIVLFKMVGKPLMYRWSPRKGLKKVTRDVASNYRPSKPDFNSLQNYEEIFKEYIIVLNILFVHQHLNGGLPDVLLGNFKLNRISHSFITRGKALGLLQTHSVKTSFYGLHSFPRLAIKQWMFSYPEPFWNFLS